MEGKMKTMIAFEKRVLAFFKKHNGCYTNSHGINFWMHGDDELPEFSVVSILQPDDGSDNCITIEMHTVHYGFFDFILGYEIGSLKDFDRITEENVCHLYLLNEAFASASCYLDEYEDKLEGVAICFKIGEDATFVYSKELHFYDETPQELYTAQHFMQYIQHHKKFLDWLVENHGKLRSNLPKKFELKDIASIDIKSEQFN